MTQSSARRAVWLGTIFAGGLVLACGEQRIPVELRDPESSPSLSLSEVELSFTATAEGESPPEQAISVTNGGGGSLNGLTVSVSYADEQATDWLGASLSATTAPSTLTLTAATGALTAGEYTATVAVASPVASNSPRTVSITFTVEPPPPALALAPTEVSFSAAAGGEDPPAQTVSVTNAGGHTLNGLSVSIAYAEGGPEGWLGATLSATTAPSTLTLAATTGSLAAGTYTATVTVASDDADNGPQTVGVTFEVTAPDSDPSIALSSTTASFSATAGGDDPAPTTISVTNGGGGTLEALSVSVSYTAGQPDGWLTATLGSTTAPATVTLTATTGSLAAGSYTATVSVRSSVARNSPQAVSVTFTISPASTYTLAVNVSPTSPYIGGAVTKSPNQTSYAAGTAVTLTATPSSGFQFDDWSGAVVSSSNPVTVTMNANQTVTANFGLKAPVLTQPSVAGQTVTLSWTYEWPCGTPCLASSNDGYVLEESATSSTSGFTKVLEVNGRQSPYATNLTRAPGTYYYRVRAFSGAGYSPYSAVRSVTVRTTGPTQIRVINDLPGIQAGTNDWQKLNTIIRVRVGPTRQSVVQLCCGARELLYPWDTTTRVANLIDIAPGEQMDLDVSDQSSVEYWLYIQTGWWDYFAFGDYWAKHMAVVVGCNGAIAYKWTTIRVFPPFGSPEVIRAGDFLPDGNWYGSEYCN